MTRKDYELIAKAIRETFNEFDCTRNIVLRDRLIGDFAYELKATNPRFDKSRFIKACNEGREQA